LRWPETVQEEGSHEASYKRKGGRPTKAALKQKKQKKKEKQQVQTGKLTHHASTQRLKPMNRK
jgi:hypothetical protein